MQSLIQMWHGIVLATCVASDLSRMRVVIESSCEWHGMEEVSVRDVVGAGGGHKTRL